MTIHEIEEMLGERGKAYAKAEVRTAREAYGSILPEWYARLWTEARIFDAEMHVYETQLDDVPEMRLNLLKLDGPDDGWKEKEYETIIQGGYFPIATWGGGNYYVLVRSDSTGPDAKVWIIDHEYVDDLGELDVHRGLETFTGLLGAVVNWPILRAMDIWEEKGRAQEKAERQTAMEGLSEKERMEYIMKPRRRGLFDISLKFIREALAGRKEEWDSEDPLGDRLVLMYINWRQECIIKAVARGKLPHYSEGEYPLALDIFWQLLERYPNAFKTRLQTGPLLFRSISEAYEAGIPHSLFVVGRDGTEFITIDLDRQNPEFDCPVVGWPSGRQLTDSLGDWLLAEITRNR